MLRETLRKVMRTDDTLAATAMRLALGGVMFAHGAQKALGWFGGYGISGTMGYFTGQLGIPAPLAALAIAAEFGGSLLLIAGALTRLAAVGIGTVMVVAALTVHAEVGFFMNWSGQASGEGFEFHILAVALSAALLVLGGGRFSVDRAVGAARGA